MEKNEFVSEGRCVCVCGERAASDRRGWCECVCVCVCVCVCMLVYHK